MRKVEMAFLTERDADVMVPMIECTWLIYPFCFFFSLLLSFILEREDNKEEEEEEEVNVFRGLEHLPTVGMADEFELTI